MSDNASLRIWQALQPMIRKEITKGTESSVKSKKMVVTTAYNTTTRTVGVTEAFGSEIQVPVAGGVNPNSLTVGRAVWVIALHGSWSNAMVCMFGDGTNGYDPNDYITKRDMTDLEQYVYGSDAYSASAAYAVGDTCTHGSRLWKCKVACSGVEPSEGMYWTQVSLGMISSDVMGFGSQIGSGFYCKGLGNSGDSAKGIKITASPERDQLFFLAYAGSSTNHGYGIIIGGGDGAPIKYMNTTNDITLTASDNVFLLETGAWSRCIVASYLPFDLTSY